MGEGGKKKEKIYLIEVLEVLNGASSRVVRLMVRRLHYGMNDGRSSEVRAVPRQRGLSAVRL